MTRKHETDAPNDVAYKMDTPAAWRYLLTAINMLMLCGMFAATLAGHGSGRVALVMFVLWLLSFAGALVASHYEARLDAERSGRRDRG